MSPPDGVRELYAQPIVRWFTTKLYWPRDATREQQLPVLCWAWECFLPWSVVLRYFVCRCFHSAHRYITWNPHCIIWSTSFHQTWIKKKMLPLSGSDVKIMSLLISPQSESSSCSCCSPDMTINAVGGFCEEFVIWWVLLAHLPTQCTWLQ